METIESLKQKKSELLEQYRFLPLSKRANRNPSEESLFEEIRAIEQKILNLNRIDLVNDVNRTQQRNRAAALIAWECETPLVDITNSDGSFHATKVKKYPKLAALKYARATWKDNRITELNIEGRKFQMFRTKSEYNKPTVHTRPESFEDFLALNRIMPKDYTIEEFNEIAEKVNQINAEFQKHVEEFDKAKDRLGLSALCYWGLMGHQNAGHIYKYVPMK